LELNFFVKEFSGQLMSSSDLAKAKIATGTSAKDPFFFV
jgi:hypothetical protein